MKRNKDDDRWSHKNDYPIEEVWNTDYPYDNEYQYGTINRDRGCANYDTPSVFFCKRDSKY